MGHVCRRGNPVAVTGCRDTISGMKPTVIAVTLGDPAGIGPEVAVAAWDRGGFPPGCRALVLGHPEVVRRAVQLHGLNLQVREISSPRQVPDDPGVIACLSCVGNEAADVPPAVVDARGGQAAYEATVAAAQLALRGEIDAMVTAPLNKAALHAAGHSYPGHTELLADLCGSENVAMMLYLGPGANVSGRIGLGVAHVTLHIAMREIFNHLTVDAIVAATRLANDVARRLLRAANLQDVPRIGVCALNPHAGEQRLFGDEEYDTIAPAVERAQAEGLLVSGPLPADTLFARARNGEFDALVAMYHDQGHIALKLLDMYRAVNITLGLPIVRTSVAHGTAFDRAWQGKVEVGGMIEAIRVAALLAQHR